MIPDWLFWVAIMLLQLGQLVGLAFLALQARVQHEVSVDQSEDLSRIELTQQKIGLLYGKQEESHRLLEMLCDAFRRAEHGSGEN